MGSMPIYAGAGPVAPTPCKTGLASSSRGAAVRYAPLPQMRRVNLAADMCAHLQMAIDELHCNTWHMIHGVPDITQDHLASNLATCWAHQ